MDLRFRPRTKTEKRLEFVVLKSRGPYVDPKTPVPEGLPLMTADVSYGETWELGYHLDSAVGGGKTLNSTGPVRVSTGCRVNAPNLQNIGPPASGIRTIRAGSPWNGLLNGLTSNQLWSYLGVSPPEPKRPADACWDDPGETDIFN